MQIKTTISYHLSPVRINIIKKLKNKITDVGEDTEKSEPLCTVHGNVNILDF